MIKAPADALSQAHSSSLNGDAAQPPAASTAPDPGPTPSTQATPPSETLNETATDGSITPPAVAAPVAATVDWAATILNPPEASQASTAENVMIIIARKDVKTLAELGENPILVAGSFAVPDSAMTASLSAASLKPVRMIDGVTTDLDRVISGEVPSAMVAVVSPKQAKEFPDLGTLNVFRVPLSVR